MCAKIHLNHQTFGILVPHRRPALQTRTSVGGAILNRWPNNSQDDQDWIDFYNLYCDMNEDTLTYFDMDGEQREFLEILAEQDNEAGELAKDVLNLIYGTPIELICEKRGDCEEERYSKPVVNEVKVIETQFAICYPNPASEKVTIKSNWLKEGSQLIVYNDLNQIVLSKLVSDDYKVILDVKEFNNGVYYFCIKNENKCSAYGKLVILH